MSNLDYRYEKTANELLRKLLRETGETDWTIDDLYSLVRRTGELDINKYILPQYRCILPEAIVDPSIVIRSK